MSTSLLSRLSDNHPLSEKDDYHWGNNASNALLGELKMLLTSRACLPDIENIPLINASILNYGIDDTFNQTSELSSRRIILETRIKNAIARFEPRLTQVTVTCNRDNAEEILFTLRAYYLCTPLILEMKWSACTGRFYFNE